MAEAVGVVASGIAIGSLAAGITSSIVKLNSYWDQIQNAPEDIHDLIEELEVLSHLLADIADDQEQNAMSSLMFDSTAISRCLQHCQKGADRLKELTDKLSTELDSMTRTRKKWASAKVVLKKGQIDKYKEKLEGAIRLLSLSYQMYTKALVQLQPDIIVAKLSQSTNFGKTLLSENSDPDLTSALRLDATATTTVTAHNPPRDQSWNSKNIFGIFRYSKSHYSIAKGKGTNYESKQECEEIIAQYYGPSWLTNRTWRIRVAKTSFNWSFSPRTYNIIPDNSAVFICARNNDVKGLQSLFGKREASPFDCDEEDYTPLSKAALNCSYDVCEFLTSVGADPNHKSTGGTALDLYISNFTAKEEIKIPRLLLNETESGSDLGWYAGPKEGFLLWQQALDPFFYRRPLEERIDVAFSLAENDIGVDVFRLSVALGPLPPLAHATFNANGITLLHAVANGLGRTLCWNRSYRWKVSNDRPTKDPDGWQPLLKELIVEGANVHFISSDARTPFLYLFHGLGLDIIWDYSAYDYDRREIVEPTKLMDTTTNHLSEPNAWTANMTQKIHLLLNIWLLCLQESGVDLEKYGRIEMEYHQRGLLSWTWPSNLPGVDAEWFLTILTYGPSPSNWKIDIKWREAAPSNPGKMPGGWVDDDGSKAEDDDLSEDEPSGENLKCDKGRSVEEELQA